jgi:hypothetical protein
MSWVLFLTLFTISVCDPSAVSDGKYLYRANEAQLLRFSVSPMTYLDTTYIEGMKTYDGSVISIDGKYAAFFSQYNYNNLTIINLQTLTGQGQILPPYFSDYQQLQVFFLGDTVYLYRSGSLMGYQISDFLKPVVLPQSIPTGIRSYLSSDADKVYMYSDNGVLSFDGNGFNQYNVTINGYIITVSDNVAYWIEKRTEDSIVYTSLKSQLLQGGDTYQVLLDTRHEFIGGYGGGATPGWVPAFRADPVEKGRVYYMEFDIGYYSTSGYMYMGSYFDGVLLHNSSSPQKYFEDSGYAYTTEFGESIQYYFSIANGFVFYEPYHGTSLYRPTLNNTLYVSNILSGDYWIIDLLRLHIDAFTSAPVVTPTPNVTLIQLSSQGSVTIRSSYIAFLIMFAFLYNTSILV